jgi:hypothetical protein
MAMRAMAMASTTTISTSVKPLRSRLRALFMFTLVEWCVMA